MTNAFIDFFKEPPFKETIRDEQKVKDMYTHFRWRIFYSSFIAYVVFHLCRKNIAVALPSMGEALHLSNTELGLLGSSLYITYGVGKFVNGVIADKANVRTFLPTALILSAICNLCFVISTMFITPGHVTFFGLPSATVLLWILCFFWGANGWFQSCGFPPVAKSLSYWFSNSERGTKWSLWSTSHQIGVFSAVMLSGFAIDHFGWKAAFYIPAVICIVTGLWLFNRLRDKPQTMGLPDVEKYRNEPAVQDCEEEDEDKRSYFQIFKEHILCNPIIWMLAIAYIFVYIIRFGTEDWLVKYLVEVKGNSLTLASSKLSSLALVGAFGAILAGIISDKIFKGKRMPVTFIFLTGFALCVFGLLENQGNDTLATIIDYACIAGIGFFTAGPQMFVGGICAVETGSKKVASAATGFCGIFGYFGAILSGIGTGIFVDNFGWAGALYFWIAAAILCMVVLIPVYRKGV